MNSFSPLSFQAVVLPFALLACGSSVAVDPSTDAGSKSSDAWADTLPSDASRTDAVDGAPACSEADGWCAQQSADPRNLYGVWGAAANDVWAVGQGGLVQHWDGRAWAVETRVDGDAKLDLFGVWGSSKSDIWAVGKAGAIVHFDGAQWKWVSAASDAFCRDTASGKTCNGSLRAIWGSRAGDVWAVGRSGGELSVASHWDGSAWAHTEMTSGLGALFAVAGTGADDVWAVGFAGQIWHKGSDPGWTSFAKTGDSATFRGVWPDSKDRAWAVAEGGTVFRWKDGAWSDALAGTTGKYAFRAVSGKSATDVWAVGGFEGASETIFHGDGKTWTKVRDRSNQQALNAIWVDPSSNAMFAVGDRGTVLQKGE